MLNWESSLLLFCMSIISDKGRELFEGFLENIAEFEKRTEGLSHLKYLSRSLLLTECGVRTADPCKIVISTVGSDITGRALYDRLRSGFNIQPEMAAGDHCLLIMTVMDKKDDFDRLSNALECIDEKISDGCVAKEGALNIYDLRPEQVRQAHEAAGTGIPVRLEEAEGKISAEYIMPYPPGIPLVVPGERISKDLIRGISDLKDKGLTIQGLSGDGEIRVYGQDLLHNR